VSEQDVIAWVEQTCLLFGSRRSTALKVAAEFAMAFERGEISTEPIGATTDGDTPGAAAVGR
jgi:hypothetical protein